MKSTLTSADPSGWYEFACNSLGRQVAHWDGQYLRGGGYTFYQPNCRNFRRLYSESDVAALREELTALRDEVKRLKSHPYEMRKADKPDCLGLWYSSKHFHNFYWLDTEEKLADVLGVKGPYYYLGPIPVVVEQQPPRVVKVRYMDNEYDAIRVRHFGFVLLGHDGNGERYVTKEESEEVQS